MEIIKTFKDFNIGEPATARWRNHFRNVAIRFLSYGKSITAGKHWIRFPYYHHVFDDETRDFDRQLRYLKNYGDFISINDVCSLLNDDSPINGRYFCVSFDDGYRCCYSNMLEVTTGLDIPVIIYLPTDYIGLNEDREEDRKMIRDNLPGNPKLLSFLNWQHCREMLQHKVSFGSHTKTHARLIGLTPAEILSELVMSQQIIQKELEVPCIHFACPWGKVGLDFEPFTTKPLAEKSGYKTFATTNRGKMIQGDDLFQIKRDHLLAGWENYQLKFFFGS